MKTELRNKLESLDAYKESLIDFNGQTYHSIFGSDECLDDTPFVYAINEDRKDNKIYKIHFKWSKAGRNSTDASDWVDDWDNDAIDAVPVATNADEVDDLVSQLFDWD